MNSAHFTILPLAVESSGEPPSYCSLESKEELFIINMGSEMSLGMTIAPRPAKRNRATLISPVLIPAMPAHRSSTS